MRKKAEREELTGIECGDCRKFYAAIETWGAVGDLPACGHAVRGESSSLLRFTLPVRCCSNIAVHTSVLLLCCTGGILVQDAVSIRGYILHLMMYYLPRLSETPSNIYRIMHWRCTNLLRRTRRFAAVAHAKTLVETKPCHFFVILHTSWHVCLTDCPGTDGSYFEDLTSMHELLAGSHFFMHAPGAQAGDGATKSGAGAAGPVREQLRQDASRHRYRYEPPATPAGFWDMGFMDSLVLPCNSMPTACVYSAILCVISVILCAISTHAILHSCYTHACAFSACAIIYSCF